MNEVLIHKCGQRTFEVRVALPWAQSKCLSSPVHTKLIESEKFILVLPIALYSTRFVNKCVMVVIVYIFGTYEKPWTNGKCLATKHHQTLFGDQSPNFFSGFFFPVTQVGKFTAIIILHFVLLQSTNLLVWRTTRLMESVYYDMFKTLMQMVELINNSVGFQQSPSGIKVCYRNNVSSIQFWHTVRSFGIITLNWGSLSGFLPNQKPAFRAVWH